MEIGRLLLLASAAMFCLLLASAVGETTGLPPPDAGLRTQTGGCPKCIEEFFSFFEGNWQLFPGLNISTSYQQHQQPAEGSRNSNGSTVATALDSFLRSVTFHVAVYNEPVLRALETAVQVHRSETGRSKKRKRFQFLSVYTVFAIAFALMSALVGKALTISIVSLVITLVLSRVVRGGFFDPNNNPNNPNRDPNTPIYDIVRRPQVQVQHTHSAEEIYEVPTGGTTGGSVSYVYASAPLRGRTVATDPYSPFAPNAVHVSSITAADTTGTTRHEIVAE